jgi:hypothetical protein
MTEQPPYSLLVRGIDADVLPVAEQFGMGVLPWLLARRSRSRLATSWIMETIHGQLLRIRYHVVAQHISPTRENWSRRASK